MVYNSLTTPGLAKGATPSLRVSTKLNGGSSVLQPAASRTALPISELQPDQLMQLGLGFWASKTLLSAVELGLFTLLAVGPLSLDDITRQLQLHPRSARDFLDALVSLRVLDRKGEVYWNTPQADHFLDKAKPSYIGGLLEMANNRLYAFWGNLTTALRTGLPQNEVSKSNDLFDALYQKPEKIQEFAQAMTGISLPAARALAAKFPWHDYDTFIDVGCAQGCVPVQLALAHPHLYGAGLDLPAVQTAFESYADSFGLRDRLRFMSHDFMSPNALPKADVLIFGHILHDWDLPTKLNLLAKAYAALPPGGAVIVYEALIDDERRQNTLGLLMSLNMLIETRGGFDYTGADCQEWMRQTGFSQTRVEHLVGPDSMVIGIK